MIYQQNTQIIHASGALAMNGTLHATALVDTGFVTDIYCVKATCAAAHGIVAGSQLWVSNLDDDAVFHYRANQMRQAVSVPAATTINFACPERYTAGTPSTSELYAAGYVSDNSWMFLGFKLHLSAAEAAGETLTLTTDSKRGVAWDTVIYSKVMTSVTDIIYFPTEPIPFVGGDIIKFTWANTGAKTWGVEIFVNPGV